MDGPSLRLPAWLAGRHICSIPGCNLPPYPDSKATYLLRRQSDGYSGVFATLEEAVASIDVLEQEEN
jgi:hypothetical protein